MMNMTIPVIPEDLFADFARCETIVAVMKTYAPETFIPIFCMIAEEWAREHDKDVCELIDTTAELIHGVNAACGRY